MAVNGTELAGLGTAAVDKLLRPLTDTALVSAAEPFTVMLERRVVPNDAAAAAAATAATASAAAVQAALPPSQPSPRSSSPAVRRRSAASRTAEIRRPPGGPLGLRLLSGPGGLGVRVLEVILGGAADLEGGVRAGDWITACNGTSLSGLAFPSAARLLNEAEVLTLSLTLDLSPAVRAPKAIERKVVTFTSVDEVARIELVKGNGGLLYVSELHRNHTSAIEVGDAVLLINGQDTRSMEVAPVLDCKLCGLVFVTQPADRELWFCAGLVHRQLDVEDDVRPATAAAVATATPLREGIGLQFDAQHGLLQVLTVSPNSSLDLAGILCGEALVKIAGVDLRELHTSHAGDEVAAALELLDDHAGERFTICVAAWPQFVLPEATVQGSSGSVLGALPIGASGDSGCRSAVVLGHVVELQRGPTGFGLKIEVDLDNSGARIMYA